MTAKIVVVGSFNADLTTYMERMPKPGETVHGRKFVTGPGGKGSNQAVAAARLGADVTFIGCVGTDTFGDMALRIWEQEHINTAHVKRDAEVATGVAPIFVDADGENTIVVVLGANMSLLPADIEAVTDVIAGADIVLTQLEVRHETTAAALRIAHENGVPSILNPAPAAALAAETITLARYLTPNQSELATLFGVTGANLTDVPLAPQQTLILTAGGDGAFWRNAEASGQVPVFPVEVIDTTGAGDAFNAGLAVALAEGQSLAAALRFANATAALCVTRPGTANSMPQRAEVNALLAQYA